MKALVHPLRSCMLCAIAVLLILTGVSCQPAAQTPTPTPFFQMVEVTREVTREVTSEVTRLVDLPVTNTPTPTLFQTATPSLTPSMTRIPSITPTWSAPRVSILEHSACLYGPGSAYLYKYGLNATVWMRVIGRNSDGTWLFVKATNDPDSNGCWIQTVRVKFLLGDISDVPVYWMGLPGSVLYLPPDGVQTIRSGNKVTIYWNAVWMTEDDYRGYLIEAWVCQGGKQVFRPVGYVPPLRQNIATLGIIIDDEPGCLVPSNARIYSVEKHGYTQFRMIPWPPYESTATPALTPAP